MSFTKCRHVRIPAAAWWQLGSEQSVIYLSTPRCQSWIFTESEISHTIKSRVSCQKGPTRHAYAWQIGPFWQDTLDHVAVLAEHDGVMTWTLFPHYWPFVRGIHRSTMDSLHKGPVVRTVCLFYIIPSKLLTKHSGDRWAETSWRS